MPTYINVPVPEHLIPAVMALISEHMTSTPKEAQASQPLAQTTPELGAPASITTDSFECSEAELRKLWTASGPQMQKVLTKLAENGGQVVSGDDLLKLIGREHKGHKLAGMMGALGRRIKHRHQGRWPFTGYLNVGLKRWEYVMPLSNAEHILKFVPAPNVP